MKSSVKSHNLQSKMGAYLAAPITDIERDSGSGNGLRYSVGSMQGWRRSMEDAHVASVDLSSVAISNHLEFAGNIGSLSSFGVFDGHGGKEVAKFVANHILVELLKSELFREGDYESALKQLFHQMDDILLDPDNFKEISNLRTLKGALDLEKKPKASTGVSLPLEANERKSKDDSHINNPFGTHHNNQHHHQHNGLILRKEHHDNNHNSEANNSSSIKNDDGNNGGNDDENDAVVITDIIKNLIDKKQTLTRGDACLLLSSLAKSQKLVKDIPTPSNMNEEGGDVFPADDGTTDDKWAIICNNNNNSDGSSIEETILPSDKSESGGECKDGDDTAEKGTTLGEQLTQEVVIPTEQSEDDSHQSSSSTTTATPSSVSTDVTSDGSNGQTGVCTGEDTTSRRIEEGVIEPPLLLTNKAEVEQSISPTEIDIDVSQYMEKRPPRKLFSRIEALRTIKPDEVTKNNGKGVVVCNLPNVRVVSGCTAIFMLYNSETSKLYIANAGDSRGVLCRRGNSVPLSFDHKPRATKERNRIEGAGGFVSAVGRINNNLNLSRSIGDLKYKQVAEKELKEQIITAEPDVTILDIDADNDEFIVLACDGIWDVMTNQGICEFVRERLTGYDADGCKSSLEAFQTNDNISESVASNLEKLNIQEIQQEEGNTEQSGVITEESTTRAAESTSNTTTLKYNLDDIVSEVLHNCLAKDKNNAGTDNMTCMIIVFNRFYERIMNNEYDYLSLKGKKYGHCGKDDDSDDDGTSEEGKKIDVDYIFGDDNDAEEQKSAQDLQLVSNKEGKED